MNDVVGNLIDNAIYYTEKGSVTVIIKSEPKSAIINVTDTGIGFEEETKKKLFKKFSRDKRALKVNPNGSGMGLYVVKLLTDQMNGQVDCQSAGEDKGSTFSITLPIAF